MNVKNKKSAKVFVRTCQECGHKQKSKPSYLYKTDSWQDTPCRKCGITALDFGSDAYTEVGGKLVRLADDDGYY